MVFPGDRTAADPACQVMILEHFHGVEEKHA
jgi:hypothetical protein